MNKPTPQPRPEYTRDMTSKLIQIPCPVDIFDMEDAYIMRRKRIAIYKLDAIKAFKPGQEEEMQAVYAELIPAWHNVIDVDTGEILPNLADEPEGLFKLDMEQIGWLTQMLQASASKYPPKSTNGQIH